MDQPQPEPQPQQVLLPMLVAMAAAVAFLMSVTGAERRLYPGGVPELAHWGILLFGVLGSTLVYTFVMRALMKKR